MFNAGQASHSVLTNPARAAVKLVAYNQMWKDIQFKKNISWTSGQISG